MTEETWWDRVKAWVSSPLLMYYEDEPYPEHRLWNWTRWRVWVSGLLWEEGVRPPERFRRAYPLDNRDVIVYMLPPLHLIARAWRWWLRARWALDIAFRRLGLLSQDDPYLGKRKWQWPFVSRRRYEAGMRSARADGFVKGGEAAWKGGYEKGYKEGAGMVHAAVKDILEEERNALDEGRA